MCVDKHKPQVMCVKEYIYVGVCVGICMCMRVCVGGGGVICMCMRVCAGGVYVYACGGRYMYVFGYMYVWACVCGRGPAPRIHNSPAITQQRRGNRPSADVFPRLIS